MMIRMVVSSTHRPLRRKRRPMTSNSSLLSLMPLRLRLILRGFNSSKRSRKLKRMPRSKRRLSSSNKRRISMPRLLNSSRRRLYLPR